MDRRGARCDERDAVPRRKRVAHVVLFIVEDARLDAIRAVVDELAADARLAVQELVQQFAVRGDARAWCKYWRAGNDSNLRPPGS